MFYKWSTLIGFASKQKSRSRIYLINVITFSLAATVRSTAKEDTIDRSDPSSNVLSFGGLFGGSFCAPGLAFGTASAEVSSVPGPQLFGSSFEPAF